MYGILAPTDGDYESAHQLQHDAKDFIQFFLFCLWVYKGKKAWCKRKMCCSINSSSVHFQLSWLWRFSYGTEWEKNAQVFDQQSWTCKKWNHFKKHVAKPFNKPATGKGPGGLSNTNLIQIRLRQAQMRHLRVRVMGQPRKKKKKKCWCNRCTKSSKIENPLMRHN